MLLIRFLQIFFMLEMLKLNLLISVNKFLSKNNFISYFFVESSESYEQSFLEASNYRAKHILRALFARSEMVEYSTPGSYKNNNST
jgi:hypothetical protein